MAEHLFFELDGPLDATPASGQMRAANFQGFSQYLRKAGADPHRILDRHGIGSHALSDPDTHVDAQALIEVFEHCSSVLDDPLFGLHLAQGQQPEVFGCITALCRASPDMRTALVALTDYIPIIHSPEASPELVEGERAAELRWSVVHDMGVNDQANLQAALLQLKLLRALGGPGFQLSYLELAVDTRRADVGEIEKIVACPVRVRAPINAIGFAREALDAPLLSANRLLYRLLGGYLDRVKQANRGTLVDQVRHYIRGALPFGHCAIERCAEKLGMSVRSLQIHLASQDTSFSQLAEQTRIMLAKSYLQRPDATLEEIAEWLGYGEQTSFGRAFKRWTGTTPQKYRSLR